MEPLTLEALPKELLGNIPNQLLRPRELRNMALTSRALNASAIPTPYYWIVLELSVEDPHQKGLFVPKNPGLRYVRLLDIEYEESPYHQMLSSRPAGCLWRYHKALSLAFGSHGT